MASEKPTKVWENTGGEMFHDECFEEGESRAGYTPVDMNELEYDDVCASCGGVFLAEPEDRDEDGDDEDPEDPEEEKEQTA